MDASQIKQAEEVLHIVRNSASYRVNAVEHDTLRKAEIILRRERKGLPCSEASPYTGGKQIGRKVHVIGD